MKIVQKEFLIKNIRITMVSVRTLKVVKKEEKSCEKDSEKEDNCLESIFV